MRLIKFLASAALCIAGSAAFAQAPSKSSTKKVAAFPTTITCAVVPEDKVTIKDATKAKLFTDYKGNRYFFCCPGCPERFKKNPAKYAKNAHIKVPVTGNIKKKS